MDLIINYFAINYLLFVIYQYFFAIKFIKNNCKKLN